MNPETQELSAVKGQMSRSRGFACIGLDNPKDKLNVGSALRAAGVYQAALLAVSGRRYGGHSSTDTMKAFRHVPLLHVEDIFEAVPFDCVPVAVDIISGARPLPSYVHPERAFYIFGAEDATLGARITDRCRDVVYVPTNGCMNLAATVNVVLYDRAAKQSRRRSSDPSGNDSDDVTGASNKDLEEKGSLHN